MLQNPTSWSMFPRPFHLYAVAQLQPRLVHFIRTSQRLKLKLHSQSNLWVLDSQVCETGTCQVRRSKQVKHIVRAACFRATGGGYSKTIDWPCKQGTKSRLFVCHLCQLPQHATSSCHGFLVISPVDEEAKMPANQHVLHGLHRSWLS